MSGIELLHCEAPGDWVRKGEVRPDCDLGKAHVQDPPGVQDDNHLVAQRLREMAELLDAEGANPYRAIAYRAAADMLARLPRSLREILDREGVAGLDALPGIGPSIAASIAEMLASGHWSQLERHRRSVDAPALLRTVPGVGPELARRLHETLGVQSLEALETAARDGRLERLPRVGARRGDWQFTALYSNTARAHELDRVHDWVVLYGVDKDHAERQYTVVTAARGALAGRRVVRGREAECRAWYATQ